MRLRLEEAQRLTAATKDGGPQWNLVFPRGEWHGANLKPIGGSVVLTDAVFDEMTANWAKAGKPQLPIFFNHPDDFRDSRASPEEVKKAAGWYIDFRKTEAGLEALTEWTPNAIARIQAREYAFTSPEWTNRATDRRTGQPIGWWIYGAALLNDPFFNSQPRVAAADEPATPTEKHMPPEMKKRLFAALKLAETATDEEMCAAVEAKCHASVDAPEKLTAAVKAAVDPLEAKLTASEASLKASQDELTKLQGERKAEQVAALIASGKAEGKALDGLVPLLAGKSVEDVKALIAAFPVTVPVVTTGTTGKVEQTPAGARAQFNALVEEKVKAGAKYTEASKLVARDNPTLAAIVFPTTTSTAVGR